MYADMQSKIESLGKDLHAKVNVALEDGVITLDEQDEITNLQNQITDITNQISQAETEASFLLLSKMLIPAVQELSISVSWNKWMPPHMNGFQDRYGIFIWPLMTQLDA